MKYRWMGTSVLALSLSTGYSQHVLTDHEIRHGKANRHMHRSPVDSLAARFESPQRDAYQQPEKLMHFLGELHGKTVADIGAGSGYFTVRLAREAVKVIAADVDTGFLRILDDRISRMGLQNVKTRRIPYDDPMLAESEADLVLVVNTYHHIEDRAAYFRKVRSGLRIGGVLVIVDFFKAEGPVGPPKEHRISIDQVVEELRQAGFASFQVEVNLLPLQYIIKAE